MAHASCATRKLAIYSGVRKALRYVQKVVCVPETSERTWFDSQSVLKWLKFYGGGLTKFHP